MSFLVMKNSICYTKGLFGGLFVCECFVYEPSKNVFSSFIFVEKIQKERR